MFLGYRMLKLFFLNNSTVDIKDFKKSHYYNITQTAQLLEPRCKRGQVPVEQWYRTAQQVQIGRLTLRLRSGMI